MSVFSFYIIKRKIVYNFTCIMKKIQNTLNLPKISIEQQRVVDLISNKKNVIVNGFPNSGKTYSIFYILENFKNKAKLSNKKF